jgi:GGDEF domain-containing protein
MQRADRSGRRRACFSGLCLILASPAVSAQLSVPAPRTGHLVAIALITLVLVIMILTYLRRHRASIKPGTGRRPIASTSDRGSPPGAGSVALEETDHSRILEAVGACLRQSRREGSDLSVIRLGLDADLGPTDRYALAAINETLISIARMRAVQLFLLGPGDYLLLFSGELPDQAHRIAEDFRDGLADLALTAHGGPLTASLGLCSGPADAGSSARNFIDCADAQLQIARKRGGNRVEARQD